MSLAKSPARAPPSAITIPNTPINLAKGPQSINVDIDDQEDEGGEAASRLTSSCLVIAAPGSFEASPTANLGGWKWYHAREGLLEFVRAVTHGGDPSEKIQSLGALTDVLFPAAGPSPIVYYSLSMKSYRVYQLDRSEQPGSYEVADEGDSPYQPDARSSRGGTKDKITSAVAYDFVSGIMKGVIGSEPEAE